MDRIPNLLQVTVSSLFSAYLKESDILVTAVHKQRERYNHHCVHRRQHLGEVVGGVYDLHSGEGNIIDP